MEIFLKISFLTSGNLHHRMKLTDGPLSDFVKELKGFSGFLFYRFSHFKSRNSQLFTLKQISIVSENIKTTFLQFVIECEKKKDF